MASCKSIREIYANVTIIVILKDTNAIVGSSNRDQTRRIKNKAQMLTFKGNNKRIENLYLLAYLRYAFYVTLRKRKEGEIKVNIDCS